MGNLIMTAPTQIPLHEMMSEKTIRAKVGASSWEGAADAVGQLLVEAGCVQVQYVDAMKRVLKEMGPYAVLAPGIVLLHARPEDGVIKPCLALVTLSRPVNFGSKENDPVDLVFAFGAVDKSAHILALQELSQLLMDSQTLKQLRDAQDDRALLSTIRGSDRAQEEEI